MAQHFECPGCACLIRVVEATCPLCGVNLRRTSAGGVIGLSLFLGLMTASCNDKDMPDPTTVGSAYAAPATESSISGPTSGPDEPTTTAEETTTTGGSTTDEGSTTAEETTHTNATSAYAAAAVDEGEGKKE